MMMSIEYSPGVSKRVFAMLMTMFTGTARPAISPLLGLDLSVDPCQLVALGVDEPHGEHVPAPELVVGDQEPHQQGHVRMDQREHRPGDLVDAAAEHVELAARLRLRGVRQEREVQGGHRGHRRARSSIARANSKSFAVKPPEAWVQSVRVTSFQWIATSG